MVPSDFTFSCTPDSDITLSFTGAGYAEAGTIAGSHCTVRFRNTTQFVVAANDSCMVNLFSLMLTVLRAGAPSPSPAPQGLARAKDLNDNPQISLATFHTLEHLLNQTQEGRRLTELYWQHTREIVSMVATNLPLGLAAAEVWVDFQPAVTALLSTKGNSVQISQQLVDELNSVWDQFITNGSPQLKAAMQTERARFHNFQDFAGKNFSQWATMLQVNSPTNPVVALSSPKYSRPRFDAEANYIPNFNFSLWRTPDFTNWQQVSNSVLSRNGDTLQISDTNSALSPRYYQLRAAPVP
jgi:hypothetical protein